MADTTGIKQTPNIGLYQPDYANIADIQVLDENFEILDKANTHDLTLYVDAGAPESGDGSQEKPFKTVQEAIDRGHLGKGVVYIEIAEGNYPERITTPRAPHITWRLTGTGTVTLHGALFDDCNYIVLNNLTFTMPTGTVAVYVVQIANCNNCAVIDCTINGQASMTSMAINNSRARLESIKINNGGIAIGANNNSIVYAHQTSGTNNVVGLHADGAIINVIKNDIVATTPYVRMAGGIINTENGDQAYPSNFSKLKLLGTYTDVDSLRADLMIELQTLGLGESKECYFGSNIVNGFGCFVGEQRLQVNISKTSDYRNGYGSLIFRSHNAPSIGYMNVQDGSFVNPEPVEVGGTMTGAVLPYLGSNIPTGYLPCEGAEVSRTTYARLFAVIGTTYGAGNGSTTFNLPNMIGRFLEGASTAGAIKNAGLPNITGELDWSNAPNNYCGMEITETQVVRSGALRVTKTRSIKNASDGGSTFKTIGNISIDASQSSAIYGESDTVQPPAVTVKYCIKY